MNESVTCGRVDAEVCAKAVRAGRSWYLDPGIMGCGLQVT